MTRDELAKAAKISPNTIADWEKGKIQSPRDLFARLSGVLNLSLTNLRQGLAIVRTHEGEISSDETSEREQEIKYYLGLDATDLTPEEIETEIVRLYSENGRIETRIRLLQMKLAVRHGLLRSRS